MSPTSPVAPPTAAPAPTPLAPDAEAMPEILAIAPPLEPLRHALEPDAAALRLDELTVHPLDHQDGHGLLRDYREAVFQRLPTGIAQRLELQFAWPRSLFIPRDANWRDYWFVPPPAANRYRRAWTEPGETNATSRADAATGTLWAFAGLRAEEAGTETWSGLGVLYEPSATLSTVSIRPTVTCSGDTRWFNLYDNPVGQTLVRTMISVSAWRVDVVAGTEQFELVGNRNVVAATSGPNSGSGFTALTPYTRQFAADDLAVNVLLQGGRRYLLGVSARVLISSTLTDGRGRRFVHDGARLKVHGSIGCRVPKIEVPVQTVHIA